MPHLGPIKRKDLIYYLKQLGFEGPYPGGNHQYMVKEKRILLSIYRTLIKVISGRGYWSEY